MLCFGVSNLKRQRLRMEIVKISDSAEQNRVVDIEHQTAAMPPNSVHTYSVIIRNMYMQYLKSTFKSKVPYLVHFVYQALNVQVSYGKYFVIIIHYSGCSQQLSKVVLVRNSCFSQGLRWYREVSTVALLDLLLLKFFTASSYTKVFRVLQLDNSGSLRFQHQP